MFDQLRPGDSVTVWRLDRLGRSLRHLIDTVAELEARGVAFRSLTESIDTSTPGGKLTFHLFGDLAEFERDLIRERTVAGLVAARARDGREDAQPSGPLTRHAWPCRCTNRTNTMWPALPESLGSAGHPSTVCWHPGHARQGCMSTCEMA